MRGAKKARIALVNDSKPDLDTIGNVVWCTDGC